jgi:site-specific recombinase XerD
MVTTKTLSSLIQSFFAVALPQRGASPLTVLSYRDAMKLMLRYASTRTKRPVVKLQFDDITPKLVGEFLSHLESERRNSVGTRNNRLAALRSFFSFVATEEPELADRCHSMCAIPFKKGQTTVIPYLEQDEMDAVLGVPNRTTRLGRFHYASLLFLYNSGARVAEFVSVRANEVQLHGSHRQVLLHGKGKKDRICPLWQETAKVLREHMAELRIPADSDQHVFVNRRGEPLSRHGVNYIVAACASKAAAVAPTIARKRVSPHTIRHTTAVHLLNAGVDIDVIRAWLGHVDLRTTNIYAEINLATKRRALEMCAPKQAARGTAPTWKTTPDVLAWLESL